MSTIEWVRTFVESKTPSGRVKAKTPPSGECSPQATSYSFSRTKKRKLGTPSRSRSISNSRTALSPLADILRDASSYRYDTLELFISTTTTINNIPSRRCETQANSVVKTIESPEQQIRTPKSNLKKCSVVSPRTPKSPSTPIVVKKSPRVGKSPKSPKSPRTPKGRSPRSPKSPRSNTPFTGGSIAGQSEGSEAFTAWWEESDAVIENRVSAIRMSCGSRKSVTFMSPLTRSPSPIRRKPAMDDQKRLSFSASPDSVHEETIPLKGFSSSPRAGSETPSDVSLPPATPEKSTEKINNSEIGSKIDILMDENTVPMIRSKLEELGVAYPKKGMRKRELAELCVRSEVRKQSKAPHPPRRLSITRQSIQKSPAAADELTQLIRKHHKDDTLSSLPIKTLSTFVDSLGYRTAKDKFILISMCVFLSFVFFNYFFRILEKKKKKKQQQQQTNRIHTILS